MCDIKHCRGKDDIHYSANDLDLEVCWEHWKAYCEGRFKLK